MRKKKIKPTNNPFKTKSEYWRSKECKDRAMIVPLLNKNAKLEKSETERVLVTGLELMPMWKNACLHATSCRLTCLEGSGAQQCMKKNSPFITAVDKCRLSRHWLLINQRELFDARLQAALNEALHQAVLARMQLWCRLDVLSEYKLRDEYAPLFPSINFYDYFKEGDRIKVKVPDNMKEIYSWNEGSGAHHLRGATSKGKPVAVVLPRAEHKKLFANGVNMIDRMVRGKPHIILVDGDASDLHSFNHAMKGQLVISVLKEKVTRYGQQATPFLESWKNLFDILKINS